MWEGDGHWGILRPQGEKDRQCEKALLLTPRQQVFHFLLKCLSRFHPHFWPPIPKPRAHLSLVCTYQDGLQSQNTRPKSLLCLDLLGSSG